MQADDGNQKGSKPEFIIAIQPSVPLRFAQKSRYANRFRRRFRKPFRLPRGNVLRDGSAAQLVAISPFGMAPGGMGPSAEFPDGGEGPRPPARPAFGAFMAGRRTIVNIRQNLGSLLSHLNDYFGGV
jgi:hypothetical protein